MPENASEVDQLYTLVREARDMVPHSDVPSRWRADWCARADALLGELAQQAQTKRTP